MQALLAELYKRGVMVAPDAFARLKAEPQLGEALLARESLPPTLRAVDLAPAAPPPAPPPAAPVEAAPAPPPAPASQAAPLQAAPIQVAPAAPEPAPASPAPFTPDTRTHAQALGEPEPARYDEHGVLQPRTVHEPWRPKPLGARPALAEGYVHQWEPLADVTGNSTCEGSMSDFTKYFNDRLNKIRKLLRQRREMAAAIPISRAKAGGLAKLALIGLVAEIRTTKNGHRLIELEDETGSVNILAPANQEELLLVADSLIEDEVVGLVCKPPGRGDLLILESVVRPDVPIAGQPRRSSRGSAVAFLSDLHFGSKTFLREDWERFVRWINLEWGDSRMKALARKTNYVVVNGDIVDGIGIFPGQEEELEVKDAYDQYALAGEELNRIRDDVKLFVLPGNHDLVRPAEPQPALPEKYRKLFPESVAHVGNPCKLSIEGVEVLSYHGRSMDDWITRVSGLSYENPMQAMREMVLRRHMVPVYGLRTPIAPEHRDYLAIDTVPDVFITGHVHAAGMEQYRGITMFNASCWQSQTAYQKMHGFMPEPGKVPVFELDSGKPWMVDFHRGPAGVDAVGRSAFGTQFREPDKRVLPGDVV